MNHPPLKPAGSKISVLFVCSGNACRSQMAEAMLRHFGKDRFEALSGGTRPAGVVHPLAIQMLESLNISIEGLKSKHCEEFLTRPIDIVITVCDNASAECPTWPGGTIHSHWALPDPVFFQGTDEQRLEFCKKVAQRLTSKIQGLISLPLRQMTAERMKQELDRLGKI